MKCQKIHLFNCKVIISLTISACIDKIKQFFPWSAEFSKQLQDLKMSQLSGGMKLFAEVLGHAGHRNSSGKGL